MAERKRNTLFRTPCLCPCPCLCLCLCLGLVSVSRSLSLSVSLYLSFLFQKVQFTFYSFQDTVSVQEPGFYAKRFKKFMSTKVFKKDPLGKTIPVLIEVFDDIYMTFQFIFSAAKGNTSKHPRLSG